MIKLSLAKKFGIELVAGDVFEGVCIRQKFVNILNKHDDYREICIESFTPRLISDGIPTSIDGDVVLELTNGKGLVVYISARNVAWHAWKTWRPSMEWLAQQAADKPVTYKDATQHFGEDVQVDLHNVTYVPEGFVRSSTPESAKPTFTQEMADAGELPPVGAECKYSTDGESWFICKPMMYSCKAVFMKSHKEDNYGCKEYSIGLDRVKFKPLDTRTEKEKAVDAAIAEWAVADKPTLEFAYDYWLSSKEFGL